MEYNFTKVHAVEDDRQAGALLQVLGTNHFIETSTPPFLGFPFQLANIMYVYTLNVYIAS
jgi:hypothetical protein